MGFLSRLARFWVWLLVLAGVAYLALSNQERVPLNLPPVVEHMMLPAWLVFASFFATGALLASFYVGVDSFKKGRELRRLRSEMQSRPASEGGRRDDRIEMVTATGRPLTIDPHV